MNFVPTGIEFIPSVHLVRVGDRRCAHPAISLIGKQALAKRPHDKVMVASQIANHKISDKPTMATRAALGLRAGRSAAVFLRSIR